MIFFDEFGTAFGLAGFRRFCRFWRWGVTFMTACFPIASESINDTSPTTNIATLGVMFGIKNLIVV